MDFWTFPVFCEHRWFENGHEIAWGRRPAENKVLRLFAGDCAPRHLQLFGNNFLHFHFFLWPIAGTSFRRHFFFRQAYWYARQNNCGLGRPSMTYETFDCSKSSAYQSCCVAAILLCPGFFFPRILRVNWERQRVTCSNFIFFFFRGTFPAGAPRRTSIWVITYVTSCAWAMRSVQ